MKKRLLLICIAASTLSYSQHRNMRLLDNWDDNSIPTNASGYSYSEVFGFVFNGREYGVIGSTQGAHIIDVTKPDSIYEVDFVPGQFRGNVTHRDYDVHDNHLYMVCDQGQSGLQVADLTYLPDSVHVVYDSKNLFVKSHNIFIDSSQDILYSCGGSTSSGSNDLMMIDISIPSAPSLISNLANDVTWWSSFIGYVHDIYVENNIAYTNDNDAMHIVDMSNPTMPLILGTLSSYSDQGYNHSGYLSTNDTTYVMCDETHGKRTKVVDVSNPASITVTDLDGPYVPNSTAIAHNPIIRGDYAYVSYYYDGVQVFDITDKYNMKNIAHYDTYLGPNAAGGEGCWGVYPLLPSGIVLASDRRRGLFVLQHLTTPEISFKNPNSTYNEYDGMQHVYVSLSNELDDTVKVMVDIDTANSTGDWNVDYSSSAVFPLELVFEPGTTLDSIPFLLIDNMDIESTETIIFKLSLPTNGDISSPSVDTVFIKDNEFVGLVEREKNNLLLYPNPINSGQEVNFSYSTNYQIFDATGKIVASGLGSKVKTDTFSKGIYLVKFGNKTEKLIIH